MKQATPNRRVSARADPLSLAVAGEVRVVQLERKRETGHRITQSEIAQRSGLSLATVGRLLNGRQPMSLSNVEALAKALDVTTERLLTRR